MSEILGYIFAALAGAGVAFLVWYLTDREMTESRHRHEQIMAILNREDEWHCGPDAEGMRNRMVGRPLNPKPDGPRPKQETREE